MEQFGDELPVLTLIRILEQIDDRLHGAAPPQVVDAVKEQFAQQFPGTPFPWNDAFVLEIWQQKDSV